MRKDKTTKMLMLISTLVFLSLEVANAQNLSKVQEASVRAPSDIKVDGKLTEWGGVLQAYNPTNRIFYTISNDDQKLYLTVHTNDHQAVNKITSGGITLTINQSNQKNNNEKAKDINNIAVLYPIKVKRQPGDLAMEGIDDAIWKSYSTYKLDTSFYKKEIDSSMNMANNEILLKYKMIQVTGIPENTENPLSIYNLLGIQAASSFDHKMAFTYELAIPLKYLKASIQDPNLSYNIKISDHNSLLSPGEMPMPTFIDISDPNILYSQSTTDFWGEYTIAP
ncbi:hypothetical protein [Albibacterium sp.]|uniref:hypothetical protein n=1 Tax=Albibacterium sp. TaxID=2952885 RepID=UPI002CDADFC4|nr:hypothetical protein [Albibacterium sp.]HUH19038.1 hypothetical protein [Albibacterium sp.]